MTQQMVPHQTRKQSTLELFVMYVTKKLRELASSAWHAQTMTFAVAVKAKGSTLNMRCCECAHQSIIPGMEYGVWYLVLEEEGALVAEEDTMGGDVMVHNHTALHLHPIMDHTGMAHLAGEAAMVALEILVVLDGMDLGDAISKAMTTMKRKLRKLHSNRGLRETLPILLLTHHLRKFLIRSHKLLVSFSTRVSIGNL